MIQLHSWLRLSVRLFVFQTVDAEDFGAACDEVEFAPVSDSRDTGEISVAWLDGGRVRIAISAASGRVSRWREEKVTIPASPARLGGVED